MIYIVTYHETRHHSEKARRLILVESNPGLELERVSGTFPRPDDENPFITAQGIKPTGDIDSVASDFEMT